jgi:dTDP-4-amino-4,6-dideoxygalactose transaminase
MSTQPRSTEFISFSPPQIGEEEIAEVVDTLRSAWLTTGPKTRRFEATFGQIVGAPAALALNSCTAALHLALKAHQIGPGDEVITTTMTFAATVNVIEHCGARPVLVDVEPDTLNISPQAVAAAITPRTRAIVPVHFAGHPVAMEPLLKLAKRHDLQIIEDAAHAFPAAHHGEIVGSSNRLTAFSFYATKNYTTGEGGMLTGDPRLIERARMLSLHGMDRNAWNRYSAQGSWFYEVPEPGFKYNMMDLQAALGLAQLRKVERFQRRRAEVWEQYNHAFAASPHLETPTIRAAIAHARHLYVLRLRPACPVSREELIDCLRAQGIGTSVHFIPNHMQPFYREKYGYSPEQFPVALDSYRRMLSLPLHAGLTDEQIDRITQAVLQATAGAATQRMAA